MIDLGKINPQKLNEPDTLNQIKQKINEIVYFYNNEEAWQLSRQLRKIFLERNPVIKPEVISQLQTWAVFADYISLSAQLDQRVIEIFRKHTRDLLFLDQDILFGCLETKLFSIPSPAREEFGVELVTALKSNEQTLGPLKIGEWIASFIHRYPNQDPLGDFEERNFLREDSNAQKLNPQDKKLLVKLLKLYNGLHPHELVTTFLKEFPAGALPGAEKQVALGRAIEKQQPQVLDYPEILSQGGSQNNLQEAGPPPPVRSAPPGERPGVPPGAGERTQPQDTARPKTQPLSPAQPIRPPGQIVPPQVQDQPHDRQEITAQSLRIADLERVAQGGDPVELEKLRNIIVQDFNKLSSRVRSYVSNSPFWAQ